MRARLSAEDERMITAHDPVARRLARRYLVPGEPWDDLAQVARVGLVEAALTYDPGRGKFGTHAYERALGALRHHRRVNHWPVRSDGRTAIDPETGDRKPLRRGFSAVPLDESMADGGEREIEAIETRATLRGVLARLSVRDQRLLAMRFLLDMPPTDMERRLGLARHSASKMVRRALERARAAAA